MDPRTDKLVRSTTMLATVTAAYFLLNADYGPQPNLLDPVKNTILSAERSVKEFVFGQDKKVHNETSKLPSPATEKHP